jgi:hypothetical protein
MAAHFLAGHGGALAQAPLGRERIAVRRDCVHFSISDVRL